MFTLQLVFLWYMRTYSINNYIFKIMDFFLFNKCRIYFCTSLYFNQDNFPYASCFINIIFFWTENNIKTWLRIFFNGITNIVGVYFGGYPNTIFYASTYFPMSRFILFLKVIINLFSLQFRMNSIELFLDYQCFLINYCYYIQCSFIECNHHYCFTFPLSPL